MAKLGFRRRNSDEVDVAVYELLEAEPDVAEQPFSERHRPAGTDREGEYLAAVRAELDGAFVEMRSFDEADIVEVFVRLAGFNARASELRGQIMRVDSRRLNAFRTRELDPFLETCEFQFKVWSRLQTVKSMEWDIAKGGT